MLAVIPNGLYSYKQKIAIIKENPTEYREAPNPGKDLASLYIRYNADKLFNSYEHRVKKK